MLLTIETDMDARDIEMNLYPLEVTFTIIYSLELSVRFYADGVTRLKDVAFLFDSFLVTLAVVRLRSWLRNGTDLARISKIS